MAEQSIRDSLRPLFARLGGVVREHEILRVAASVHGKDVEASANTARREVLAWIQKRSGGNLPAEAWSFESFEHLSGGRNSVAVRLENDASDIWAIRADDPDKNVAGRVWTTEIVVGFMAGQPTRFSARLLVNTPEDELKIEPHTPGFVQQVAERCGLYRGDYDLDVAPWVVSSEDDADRLVQILVDADRALPVIVLTVPNDSDNPNRSLVDADGLGRAVLGIGQVVILPAEFTWTLTHRLGKLRSVFGGAARVYLAGFSEFANPYDHRLVLADYLTPPADQERSVRWMKSAAASESVRRNKLGRDVLAFGAIRNATLRAKQERLTHEGASEGEQLAAAQARIVALESARKEDEAALQYFDSETTNAQERAEAAEALQRGSVYLIRQLREQVRAAGGGVGEEIVIPTSWTEFSDWCDTNFAGRLALAPPARRGVKAPDFEDIEVAARCLIWLATRYRDGRQSGAYGDFRDFTIEPGIRNSPCGSDEFDLVWQGRPQTADWHVKNGGNTHDPRRCLRIYYFWEPETQQVVVADMPAHRRSGAT